MRPAAWRFGVVLSLVVACWTGAAPPTSAPAAAPAEVAPLGHYLCSISEQGYDYPPFACEIRRDGARTMLVKLEGSQRFEGEIRTAGHGFQFAGRYFCPFGDCTKALHGTFVADARTGAYRGTFSDDPELVV